MRGRSQSVLIEDVDRNLYVLKLRSTPQDSRCIANELIGTGLCHALSLSAPQSCFVQVEEQFIDRFPDAWFQTSEGRIRPPAGLHYGTVFVGKAEGSNRPLDMLPGGSKYVLDNHAQLCGMYLFDVWANHVSRRKRLYLVNMERRSSRAIFFDNGLLFGGPLGRFDDYELQAPFRKRDAANVAWSDDAGHIWLEQFKTIIPHALDQILETVPHQWHAGGLIRLQDALLQRLEKIEEIVEPFRASLGIIPTFR